MKIVVYRDKNTNEIMNFHEANDKCTDEAISNYNANKKYNTFAEIVDIEENSLCYYFYNKKVIEKNDYYERLRDLQEDIQCLSDNQIRELTVR